MSKPFRNPSVNFNYKVDLIYQFKSQVTRNETLTVSKIWGVRGAQMNSITTRTSRKMTGKV